MKKVAYMKKNALRFIAAAMMFAAGTAMAAKDTVGAIRSIDPCDEAGNVVSAGSMAAAKNVGESVYFRIRLENHNSASILSSYQALGGAEGYLRNPWRFEYFLNDSVAAASAWAATPPKVGVMVSGRMAYADIVYVGEPDDNRPWFTDIVCSYKVQPGDIALPMLLANSLGGEADDSDTTEYYLGNVKGMASQWSLKSYSYVSTGSDYVVASTNTCCFRYGEYGTFSDSISIANAGANSSTKDYTLFNAGLFLMTIDFDDSETYDSGAGIWRAVNEGGTSTLPSVPSLKIPGEVASDYQGAVYLWTENSNSVVLAGAQFTVGSNRVQKLVIDGTPDSLKFQLRGVKNGTSTDLYLSSTTNLIATASGRAVTNFLKRTVSCIEPLPPTVSIQVGGQDANQTLTASADYTTPKSFNVYLSQTYASDVKVNLRYTLNDEDVSPADLIAISDDQEYGYQATALPEYVIVPAGKNNSTDYTGMPAAPKALFVLGAKTKTGDKIVIKPEIDDATAAAYYSNVKTMQLTIKGMMPVIEEINDFLPSELESSETDSPIMVRGGVQSTIKIKVKDSYRNLLGLTGESHYTVNVSCEGSSLVPGGITKDADGNWLKPDEDGFLYVPVTFPIPATDRNILTTLSVVNAEGLESKPATRIYVMVKLPKNVTAAIDESVVGEGSRKAVTFALSEVPTASQLYAYLEPVSDEAKNLSYAPFFTENTVEVATRGSAGQGVPFKGSELTAVSDWKDNTFVLEFFDNASGRFVYNIRLCASETWDAAQRITEFTEGQIVIDVTNNVPVITQIVPKNNVTGNTISGNIMSVGDPMRTFQVVGVNDVDLDKNGADANQIVYSWEVYLKDKDSGAYASTPNLVFYTVGLNSSLNMTEMFGDHLTVDMCGEYRFSVRAQDKDMRARKPGYLYEEGGVWKYDPMKGIETGGAVVPAYPEGDALNPGNDWGDAYVFDLTINENPYVQTEPFGAFTLDTDGTPIFNERDLLNGETMGFAVGFNAKPSIKGFTGIPVEITIEPVDNDGNVVEADTDVAPGISRTSFSFTQSSYSNQFTFTEFDGTYMGRGLTRKPQRYRMTAKVTSTDASGSGTPWNELYTPAVTYFRLQNSLPEITVDPDYVGQNSETNAVMGITYAPNERFNFRWSVSDVAGDLVYSEHGTSNLIVTCQVIGGYEIGSVTNQSSGTFSVWFEKPGINKIKITAIDKDETTPVSSDAIWFFVEPSKNVYLYPYGPSRAAVDSDAIAKYRDQPGCGVGRVWSDGNFGSITSFRHSWTYNTSARTAMVYGEGYAAGETDNSTSVGKSSAPNQSGNGTDEPHYTNSSVYDSFFYRWFKLEPGKGGSDSSGSEGESTWVAGSPAPGKTSDASLTLPTAVDSYTYADSMALAIFSREKYVADNMGDINGDGIPDVFAIRTWTSDSGESKRLCEIVSGGSVSGGEGDGEGEVSDADLVDISTYNGDEDFFPVAASLSSNPLKPSVYNWGPGEPFTAIYEIRGMHRGLNEPGVSEYDLSEAEAYALYADFAASGNAITGDAAVDYVAATNWATSVKWTPEAWQEGAEGAGVRLNPAKFDSDGDGFDDGWEYYFWYYAKVGAVTNGVWGRLEGRRFSLSDPAKGTRISPAEIAEAFDPLTMANIGRDFDGDGLTDLEEYVLGTNPIDWDSDGDGMSDLYEVMNGLDPLKPTDGVDNPDRDFMARCDYEDDTFTVFTFANGEMFGLPTKASPSFAVEPVTVSTNVYRVVVIEGEGDAAVEKIYFSLAPAVNDGATLTENAECFIGVKDGETAYVASLSPITLAPGTPIASASLDGEDVSLASFYYRAEMKVGDKTQPIWFARKPAVVMNADRGCLHLATDTAGFMTYEHPGEGDAASVRYLGEPKVFPAGTLIASVADVPVNMNMVNVSKYEVGLMGATGGFMWRNPVTLESESVNLALPLFNYGGDGVTYVPCGTNVTHFSLAPVVEDEEKNLTRSPIVKVEKGHKITLIHNQVFCQYGYDPRVAWSINDDGYVDVRWQKDVVDESGVVESGGGVGDAGLAVKTVPYTSRDEYLVMQYRQQMRKIGADGIRSATESLLQGGNAYLVQGSTDSATVAYLWSATTYPNLPISFVQEQYASRGEVSPFDNSTNSMIVAYWTDVQIDRNNCHGADTDGDGVPDGWELYVNSDPNNEDDAKLDADTDKLTLIAEYAGVDSCNAYTNRFDLSGKLVYPEAQTITKNHPGKASGWWNKFFPTNPLNDDTDGDGIKDNAEGQASWGGKFYVGRNEYAGSFSFIYGTEDNAEAYALDGKTTCFRGGGLNPCTVDTDGDLLPDAWEMQFAGVVFKDGEPLTVTGFSAADLATLTSADGKQAAVSATGCEIRGGMDGTWDGDACLDFDHDGLLNCQEYLVQSLRHLRYDDQYTPLMGVNPVTKEFVKFLPFSAWDGEAFHKRCLENGFTGLSSWKFAELGYFTRPPHEWDPISFGGMNDCPNYAKFEGAGYRVMLPPVAIVPNEKGAGYAKFYYYVNGAMQYATTDPRRWDSDDDGMDDYYEIFHGLNPLLGSASYPLGNGEYEVSNLRYDVIASIHDGKVSSWFNHWTGWPTDLVQPAFDAIRYPWMIGTMECDADGDGLRNDEESIKVNVTSPQYTHTDPTPLWMTDSTSPDNASFTSQYYNPDPYITEVEGYDPLSTYPDLFGLPWADLNWDVNKSLLFAPYGMGGANKNWMFAFEENEGFDTDHDFKTDYMELSRGAEAASDPLNFFDPDRRQALYLPGFDGTDGSAAVTRGGEFRRAVTSEPDLLRQFTVECWVKPDGAQSDAVIVERVCNYGASTLSNNVSAVRANFRIGVDASGCVYGEFEGSTANSRAVRATGGALEAGKWTHIAFTYNGKTAALYVNGSMSPVSSVTGVGVIPANGVDGILSEGDATVTPFKGYRMLPSAFVIGAKSLNGNALSLGAGTTWTDFSSYFKGWVDEVRVWDGARTATELNADYMKRYSFSEVSALRDTAYYAWLRGATRNENDGKVNLPAELLMHYNFVTMPGAVEEGDVITTPPGFLAGVLDNVRRPNGKTLDKSLRVGWWSATPVSSKVYSNKAIVPWIGNTVAHLPFMDGSCADSQYWSLYAAGVIAGKNLSYLGLSAVDSYEFPNAANPYPYYIYNHDRYNHYLKMDYSPYLYLSVSDVSGDILSKRYQFQMRSDFVGSSDLLPLGRAFAKRGADFWDGEGAMDAWTMTVGNVNEDGIPKWAIDLGYTTVEAYLRALAEGLLPNGTVNEEFAAIADTNGDGVKDWWQKMYGLTDTAFSDQDNDGLADYAEYLASEVFRFGSFDPTKASTDDKELDYFRKVGKVYLGEILSDHDFIEDWWERLYGSEYASSAVYDPFVDADGDGWGNYAECRAGTLPDRSATLAIGGDPVAEYPIPMISAKFSCKNATSITAPIVVQAYSDTALSKADATWTIPGSSQSMSHERMLGMNPGSGTLSINLGPGCVVPGTVSVEFRDPTEVVYTFEDYTQVILAPSETTWHLGLKETVRAGEMDIADITKVSEPVGTISYRSGTLELDLSKLTGYFYYLEDGLYMDYPPAYSNNYNRIDLSKSYMRVAWESVRVAGDGVWDFTLSTADSGHVREGKNTFVAFVDLNEDGKWSEGEPMGVVNDVDVGWNGMSLEMDLTETTPVCPRPSLESIGISDSATNVSVYVYRYLPDAYTQVTTITNRMILSKEISNRTNLHEGDFLADGNLDIDWENFPTEVTGKYKITDTTPLTSMTYRVYSQPVNIMKEIAATSGVPYVQFSRIFGRTQAKAEPAAAEALSAVFYGNRPTFKWTIGGELPETYTAFAIKVTDSASKVVWNSGKLRLPPRDTDGAFKWTPPLYVGDQTSLGKVFENQANYTWQVSVYNSKFQSDNWSAARSFRMNVFGADEVNIAGKYSISAAVKYYGPGVVDGSVAKVAGTVRVEAFTTPDFTGTPAGRTFVTDIGSVTNVGDTVNATIIGLDPGTYYIRAYIDSDGDFARSNWESWGYYCARAGGTDGSSALFTPLAVTVGSGVKAQTAKVYIEDTDVDQDCLPDVYEYDTAGTDKKDFLLKNGPMENENNGYISVNPNLKSAIEDLINGGATVGLLSASSTGIARPLAALMANVESVDPEIDATTLSVTSLELVDGKVALTLSADAVDPLAGSTMFVSAGKVSATLVVKYADALDGEWNEVREHIEFEVEDASAGAVFTKALSDLGLDATKGFFKVEIVQ